MKLRSFPLNVSITILFLVIVFGIRSNAEKNANAETSPSPAKLKQQLCCPGGMSTAPASRGPRWPGSKDPAPYGTPAGTEENPFLNEDCAKIPTIDFPHHDFRIYTRNMAFSETTLELTSAGIVYVRKFGRVTPQETLNDGTETIFEDVQPEKGFYLAVRSQNGKLISRFSYAPVLTNCRAPSASLIISEMDRETPRLIMTTPPVALWPVGRELVIPGVEDTSLLPRARTAGYW